MSLVFWYIGLVPDLAVHAGPWPRTAGQRWSTALLALGWRGSAIHWRRYEKVVPAAGRARHAAGVLGAHGRVSFDFAVAIVPVWHATIFPPFFVAGAIFSGFAMVLVLAVPLRSIYGLEDFITTGTWTTAPRSCSRPG